MVVHKNNKTMDKDLVRQNKMATTNPLSDSVLQVLKGQSYRTIVEVLEIAKLKAEMTCVNQ